MIAADSKKSRLATGKAIEQEIAALMPLFNLVPQTVPEMMDRAGVDRVLLTPRGQLKTLQIKYRETGQDILVDVYDPFYGEAHPDTRPGRDVATKCDFVACRIGDFIHLIHGLPLQKVVQDALEERRVLTPIMFNCAPFRAENRVLLKSSFDHRNSRPKLLAFVPITSVPKRHIWTKNIFTGETIK